MLQNLLILIDFTKKLYKSRYMVFTMAMRDLRAAYVGNAFGLGWAVLNPLFMVLVYGVVFGVFFNSTPDAIYNTDSYFIYLISGLVPWQFVSQAITSSTGILASNRNLVKKAVGFPSEILGVVNVISNLISHFIGLALLFVAVVVFTNAISPYAFFVIAYVFLGAIFTIGVGWLLSSLNIFVRDVTQVLNLIMMALFFFTPVFYSPSIVPQEYFWVYKLNPFYHFVEGYRLAFLVGAMPGVYDFVYLCAVSFGAFGLGGVFYRKLKPSFAEVL